MEQLEWQIVYSKEWKKSAKKNFQDKVFRVFHLAVKHATRKQMNTVANDVNAT